jgi:hypothetical protein
MNLNELDHGACDCDAQGIGGEPVGARDWDRWRFGCHYLEMTAAMFAPLLVLLPLLWAGIASGGTAKR